MKTLDPATLESLFELDRDTGGTLVSEMIESFRAEHPTQFSNLLLAISSRNGTTVSFQAHAMKSTFANFGASHIANVLGRIESAGKKSDWITIEIAGEELNAQLRNFHSDLLKLEELVQLETQNLKKSA